MRKVVRIISIGKEKQQGIGKKGYDGDQIVNTSNTNTGQQDNSGKDKPHSGGKKDK
jgi:hypothetical protein